MTESLGARARKRRTGDCFTTNYQAIYQRDLPQMRAMGVNCVRVYGWAPGADHTDFLNQAYNSGGHPIYVFINNYLYLTNWVNDLPQARSDWAGITTNALNHPAVLGYLIGNELNDYQWHLYGTTWSNVDDSTNPDCWNALNAIAGEILKHDTQHLVSTPLKDNNITNCVAFAGPYVANFNVWCAQVYRGSNFGTLFVDYTNVSAKSLVLTEYGCDAFNHNTGQEYPNNAQVQSDYVQSLWLDLASHADICSGGAVFPGAMNGGNIRTRPPTMPAARPIRRSPMAWRTRSGGASIPYRTGRPMSSIRAPCFTH